jgi:AGCS family alanine or glycine:cation symporter
MRDFVASSSKKTRLSFMNMKSRHCGLLLLLCLAVLAWTGPAWAQEEPVEKTIDQRINDAMQPLTRTLGSVLFSGFEFSNDATSHDDLEFEGVTLYDPVADRTITDGRERIVFPFIVLLLISAAVYFTFFMKFINFRGFKQSLRIVSGKYDNPDDPGEVTHFQALTAALSGTVGLGNIAGVAIAVSIGGPGATFWMILAGLFGMTSKFVECTLGHHYRKIDEHGVVSGGPMYYLKQGLAERGLPGLGKILAALAAILCLFGAFGSGALFQVNQATQQFANTFELATGSGFFIDTSWSFGMIYAAFAGFVIIGGIRKIAHVTEFLVPTMAAIYLSAALIIILFNIADVPAAFGAIFEGAFSPKGVTGGLIGVLIQGLRRASFSNEAGLGSAAIAHAAAKTKEPVAEGLVALIEPFIDTVVVCTATALVIILTGMHEVGGANGITLTSNAFASVFAWFPYILAVAVVLFAFSTSITWFYYGQRCFVYLFGQSRTLDLGLKVAFLATVIVGSAMQLTTLMDFADAMLLSMAFPNIVGLFILAPKVKRMLGSYLTRVESGEIQPFVAAGQAKLAD